MSPTELSRRLEAVLMVCDEPTSTTAFAAALEWPVDAVEVAIRALSAEYEDEQRGFRLREVAGGWRLYSASEHSADVERLVSDGQQARLTQAALETLAVVAYQQPVSRGRVAGIRGVSVDGVMRTLAARGLVAETGSEPATGAVLYGTTPLFLEKLGLTSLSELPPLAPLLPDLQSFLGEQDETST